MFAAYEDEFGELASEIGQKLKKVEAEPMTRDDAEEAMDEVDGLLTELRTVTRSMEMGKRDVPGAERAACERRLHEYTCAATLAPKAEGEPEHLLEVCGQTLADLEADQADIRDRLRSTGPRKVGLR